ncbi:MAG: recombinase family protein [Acutalibacteraceae bacterium]
MKIGYIRISTADPNTARQEVLMRELGVEQVFIERMSGKNTDRPKLKRMMSFVREGDTVIVEAISRFARNTKDLLDLVEQLTEKFVLDKYHKNKAIKAMTAGIENKYRISICKKDERANNGGCTEPHISHVLAARLSSRPLAWSETTLESFLHFV